MRASFNNPQSAIRNPQFFEPPGELKGQQFAKQWTDADAGVEITPPTDVVIFLFIKSTIWTIQRQFHKLCEGNRTVFRNFGAYSIGNSVQKL